MVKHFYKHIGYFDEVGDIRSLSLRSADDILDYYKKGYGSFHENRFHEEDTDLIAEEETLNVKNGNTRFTSDKKFAITDESWNGWAEEYIDSEDGDCANCYIDIYELYKEEEEDITFEVCPYCGNEVELDAELKVQVCPVCGKHIVTCSMCKNVELNYPCKDCCLEILAHTLNEENKE